MESTLKSVSVSWGPALSTFGLGSRDPDSLMSHSLIPIHTISSHASIAPPSTNQIRVRNKLDQSNANEEAWDEIVWIGIREWLIRESGSRPPKPNVLRAGPQLTDTIFITVYYNVWKFSGMNYLGSCLGMYPLMINSWLMTSPIFGRCDETAWSIDVIKCWADRPHLSSS